MRKLLIILTIACLALLGCKKSVNNAPDATGKDIHRLIGISKIITHPALDDLERGIIDEIKAQGYDNLSFDLQNANGETSTAASIAGHYKSRKVDIAVGIATPMALALANGLKDTPIVFSAVTDPIDAELRKENGPETGSYITGVSDLTPVREQIKLAARLVNLKKLGFIYNAGESNSVVLLKITQDVCKEMGIELVTSTVTNTSEIKQATEIVAPKVDAIYASTDNVVYASLASLVATADKYNVPVVAAVPSEDDDTGILAAYGINYYNAGRVTGKVILRILNGEKAGDIPVKYLTEPDELGLFINFEVAERLGIEIPEDLRKQAGH